VSGTKTAPARGGGEHGPRSPSPSPSTTAESDAGGEATAPAAIHPGDIVGRYQILALLGAGGMGQVFAALDPELGRTVALKVIRPGRRPSSRDRTRLLREAQALARLQHPNVVAIHDVGTHGDQVFIAMEHVAGPTLTEWLASAQRPWRAIRDVFVAAGRGLVAAHAVGIIHRDFKPSNVIVGADRVVVVDFGLARARGDEAAREASDRSSATSVLEVDLTLTGERVGTPLYMAPEQHLGDPVTARADQFAFATSLWAALYGDPPFSVRSAGEALQGKLNGPQTPTSDRGVPERVRAALARALAFQPADRWPALSDLLAELAHDPAARRLRLLAVAGLAAAAIAAPLAFAAGRQETAPSCAAPETGLWDERARAGVRAAFLATGAPHAADSFERVDASLRRRLAALGEAHEETCAATEIRHEQSAALMDARMACLGRAREEIAAFVNVLGTADLRGVERATGAARDVGDLEGCAHVSPDATSAAPRDPVAAAKLAEVEREAARFGALLLVGRMNEARAAGPALVERARETGHTPLLARVLFEVSTPRCEGGDPREGAATLYEAARAASASHDDVLAAKIYIKLVYCAGAKDANVAAAAALVETAEAALARIGSPLELRARLYREESRVRRHAGDLVNAFGFAVLSLQSYQRRFGEASPETGPSLGDLGDILTQLGGYGAAREAYARAIPLLQSWRGPGHPVIATYLSNLGMAEAETGDLDAAAGDFTRAIAIWERNDPAQAGISSILRNLADVRERQGQLDVARELLLRAGAIDERTRRPGHPAFGYSMVLLAVLALDRGAPDEAQRLADRARAIFLEAYGPAHRLVADVDLLSARIAHHRRDLAGARRLVEQALAVQRQALGPRHPSVASGESLLGAILLDGGQAPAARPLLEGALAVQERARGETAAEVVVARTLLSEALRATGDRGRAIVLAERAVAAAGQGGLRGDIDGRARFALAQALEGGDGRRARELARQARILLAGSPAASEVPRVDRWLERL
jgi:tetratricopeptide (TPR) repeat protein/predicted Ser/Thr protein kinase